MGNRRGTWAAIQRLRGIWEENHSAVATGALNALAGFDYQFVLALRDTVKRWLSEDHGRRGEAAVFTEILSDVLDITAEGPVHVTQVKRTQSGSTVRTALEDLWSIYRLASASEPALSEIMGYRIASARSKIRDVHDILSTWKPNDVEEGDPALQAFRLRVSIDIDVDPESELLTLLANECRADEPLAVVHRWLGRLVHAASTPNGFVTAGTEIWNDLYALSASADRNKTRAAIYFWQQHDCPPEGVQPGSYLTGERPLPRHLRLGFFAPRDTILGPLSAKIITWLTPHPASSDDSLRLPVFWIGGRSGTGKSVALLQILSLIHAEQIGPILWLGPHIAALSDAIRWGRRIRRHGETVVIGLDDPYAPVAQNDAVALWQQAISEMITTRQGDDPTELPVILCCGPTEQAERFERELSDDVSLTREDLPQESSEDHEILRSWFRRRTGHEAPEIGDGDVLLVQLFFEWKVGTPLQAFANRLRQRVAMAETGDHGRELIDQFSRILALNRIYVGYPRGAVEQTLTPDQKGVFLRLQQENHLVTDPDDARPGVWLAHPHLSNAIYTAWHPGPAAEPVRRQHLWEGIFSSIEYGDNPSQQQSPLWAISRALEKTLADSTLADRLAGEDLVSLLEGIYRSLIQRYAGTLPLFQLPVWIGIRSLCPDILLDPDPVEAGIAALLGVATGETGLRLTCHKLLRYLTRHSGDICRRIEDASIHLLELSTEWREWVPIMFDAVRICRRPELGPIIAHWVDNHRKHPMAPALLKLALEYVPGAEIREKALQLIAYAGEGIEWGDVALLLLGRNVSSVPTEIAAWAERHRATFGVCFVLGRLLTARYPPAISWSVEWARNWYREASANWVLEPLIQCGEEIQDVAIWSEAWIQAGYRNAGRLIQLLLNVQSDNVRLHELAIDWLRQTQYSDGSWSYAWEGLRDVRPKNDELIADLGLRWLEATPLGNGSWPFVWTALEKATPGDAQLRDLGLRWLEATPLSHGSWRFVWTALEKATPEDGQLRELGLRWLEATPLDYGSWPFIWTALEKATPEDGQLRELGLRWLATAPLEHGSWPFVWTALEKATPEDGQLREIGLHWLASAPLDHGSWPFVWQALEKATPGDAQLRELGLRWLATTQPDHGSWQHVWAALERARPGDAQLRELGLRWLATAPLEHGSWAFVWMALDQATPEDVQLRELGLRWLATAPVTHGSWQYVWTALRKATPGDAQLRELSLRWLATAPLEHGSWAFVWMALDQATPGDLQLRELGLYWLATVPVTHGSWQYVWTALGKATPGDAQLREIGLRWIATAPLEHGSWTYVWESLDKATPGDVQLRELGLRWLATAPLDHGSWAFVWMTLDKATPGDAQLRELALRWLATAPPTHGSWEYMWTTLGKATPGDAQLRELGLCWIASAPLEHGSWTYMWEALDKVIPGDARLRELGLRWIATVPPNHRSWAFVWTALDKATPADAQLREIGLRWIATAPPAHGGWAYVWQALDKATPGAQLTGLALRWLNAAIQHRSWSFVWIQLWNRTPFDEELLELGNRFLQETSETHFRRQNVESALGLRKAQSHPLRAVSGGHDSNSPIPWISEWENGEDRAGLVPIGMKWVQESIAHRLWASVFIRLWEAEERSETMQLLGRHWIAANPNGRRADEVRKLLSIS